MLHRVPYEADPGAEISYRAHQQTKARLLNVGNLLSTTALASASGLTSMIKMVFSLFQPSIVQAMISHRDPIQNKANDLAIVLPCTR